MSDGKETTGAQEFRTPGAYIPSHARGRPSQPPAIANANTNANTNANANANANPALDVHPYFVQNIFSETMSTYKEVGLTPESPPSQTLNVRNMDQYMGVPARSPITPISPSPGRQTRQPDTKGTYDDSSDSSTTVVDEEAPPSTTAHSSAYKRKKNRNKKAKAKAKAKRQAQVEKIKEQAPGDNVPESSKVAATSEPSPRPEVETTTPEKHSEEDLIPENKPAPRLELDTTTLGKHSEKDSTPKSKPASEKKTRSEQMCQPDQKPGSEKNEVEDGRKPEDNPGAKDAVAPSIKPQPDAGAVTKSHPGEDADLPAPTKVKLQSEDTLPSEQMNSSSEKSTRSLETVQTEKKVAPGAKNEPRVKAQPEKCVETASHPSREGQKKHIGELSEVQNQVQLDGKSDLMRIFGPLPVGSSERARFTATHQKFGVKVADSKAGRSTSASKAVEAPAQHSDPTLLFDKEGFEAAIGGCPVTTDMYNHIQEKSGGDLSTAVNLYLNGFQSDEYETVRRKKGQKLISHSRRSNTANTSSAPITTTAGPPKVFATKATSTPATRGASIMKPAASSYTAAASYAAAASGAVVTTPVSSQPQTAAGKQDTQRPGQAGIDTKRDTSAIPTQVTQQQKSQQKESAKKSGHRVQLNPSSNSPLNQAAKTQGKHAREKSSTTNTRKQPPIVPALPRAAYSHKKAAAMKTDTTATPSPQQMHAPVDSNSTEPLTMTAILKLPMVAPATAGAPKFTTPVAIQASKALATAMAGIAGDDKSSTTAISKNPATNVVAQPVDGSLAFSPTRSVYGRPQAVGITKLPPQQPGIHSKQKPAQSSAGIVNKETRPPKVLSSGLSYESAKSLARKDKQTLATIKEDLFDVLAPENQAARDYSTIRRVKKKLFSTMAGDTWDGSADTDCSESNDPAVAQSHGGGSAAESGRPAPALDAAARETAKGTGAETVIAAFAPAAIAAQDGVQDETNTDGKKKAGHQETKRVVSTDEKPLYIVGNTLVRPGYTIEDLTPLEKSTCITWEEATGRRTPRPVPWTGEDWAEFPTSNTPSIRGPAFLSSEERARTTYNFPYLTR